MPTMVSVFWRRRWRVAPVVALVAAGTLLSVSPARANEPTTLRVVSVTRTADGTATIVVSAPNRFVAAASSPGAFTIVTADGTALVPTVTALPPSTAAVAVVVDIADGVAPDVAARINGAAAELMRSLDPGVAVVVVTTRDTAPPGAPTTDRAGALVALAAASGAVTQSGADAANAGAARIGVAPFVDPMVVVFDSSPTTAVTTPTYAGGVGLQTISVGGAADPVSLVDDAVGLMRGRLVLAAPGAGLGPLIVRLAAGGGTLDASVPAAAPAAVASTTTAATMAGAHLAPASVPESAPAPIAAPGLVATPTAARTPPLVAPVVASKDNRTPLVWIVVLGGVGVVGLAGAGVWTRRRRRPVEPAPAWDPPGPEEAMRPPRPSTPGTTPPAGLATPKARRVVFAYRDFTAPPIRATSAKPAVDASSNGAETSNGGTPKEAVPPAPSPADEAYAKRVRVLALAEELGNISEACRVVGVSRRSFYEWKRIAEEHGNEALYPKRVR